MNNLDSVEGQLAAEVIGWQQANDRHVIERDEARAKLARIAALCDEHEGKAEDSPSRGFFGDAFPAFVLTSAVRAILTEDPA